MLPFFGDMVGDHVSLTPDPLTRTFRPTGEGPEASEKVKKCLFGPLGLRKIYYIQVVNASVAFVYGNMTKCIF